MQWVLIDLLWPSSPPRFVAWSFMVHKIKLGSWCSVDSSRIAPSAFSCAAAAAASGLLGSRADLVQHFLSCKMWGQKKVKWICLWSRNYPKELSLAVEGKEKLPLGDSQCSWGLQLCTQISPSGWLLLTPSTAISCFFPPETKGNRIFNPWKRITF